MAEIAVGGPQATDVFNLAALSANYHAQTSTIQDTANIATGKNKDGDTIIQQAYGGMIPVSCTYHYLGTPNLWTTTTSELLPRPGEIHNTHRVTQVVVAYSNTDWPTVTVTGHSHDNNTHDADGNVFTPTISLPGDFGCPDLLTNSDGTGASAPKSATYTLSADHVEADDGVGEHIAGADINGKEALALTYTGTPTLVTTGWVKPDGAANDSNSDFDESTYSLENHIARD